MSIATEQQQQIKIDVAYYSGEDQEKLATYPDARAIDEAVRAGVSIPTAEFLTYYLLHRKKLGTSRYDSFRTISSQIGTALAQLEGAIRFTGSSIATEHNVQSQLPEVSEHVGEAAGLSVISRIHGLTDADWAIIPVRGGPEGAPTFDFSIAATANRIVEVETKGSSVDDNSRLSDPLYKHASDIRRKKRSMAGSASATNSALPAAVRYGTIAALDDRATSVARCWLLDPEPSAGSDSPQRRRLLTRMRFLRDWLVFVGPTTALATAIVNRVNELERLPDMAPLDRARLLRPDGRPISLGPKHWWSRSPFLATRSHVTDGPAAGQVFRVSDHALFFAGIRQDLAELAASQSFSDIAAYAMPTASTRKTVECVVTRRRLEELRLPDAIVSGRPERGPYVSFRLHGLLHYSSGGIVFGVLPL